MKLIVAVDKEWGIGYKGDLLARVKADLMNFKALTAGKVVICGSNTVATFPGGKALKNRTSIVLHPDPAYTVEGATVVHSIDEALTEAAKYNSDDVFVIGGASIYRQMLPFVNECIITKFDKSFDKDVYFPDLDSSGEWQITDFGDEQISNPETDTIEGLKFRFYTYKRVRG